MKKHKRTAMQRYGLEIGTVLLVKLGALFLLWSVCISPMKSPPLDMQQVSQHLLN